jgi:putative spermidine/putrescine transport system permease protein
MSRPPIFYALAVLLGLFIVFLYGPIATIVVLSFQGPEGGLVFPMNGVSLHWFAQLFRRNRSVTSGARSGGRWSSG